MVLQLHVLCASAALTVAPHLLIVILVLVVLHLPKALVVLGSFLSITKELCRSLERVYSSRSPSCHVTQVSALRVDVQRLSQGKRSAEARALAAETAAQQCQQEVAALRVLTASMLAQPHTGPPFQDLEGTESAKPGFTGEGSNSVVDTLTQQQGSRVRWLATPEAVHLQQDSKCNATHCNAMPICCINA